LLSDERQVFMEEIQVGFWVEGGRGEEGSVGARRQVAGGGDQVEAR